MRPHLTHLLALLPFSLASTLSPFLIPTMNIQGHGPTGIPGGGTAPANVTISFVLQDPNTNSNTTCGATYLPSNYPQTYVPCADPAVAFKFEGTYGFAGFTLDVRHSYLNSSSDLATSSYGSVYIVGNGATGQSGNYLSCLGGAPFDGIRCHITNPSSPISVPIASTLSFKPLQLAPMSTFSPPLGSHTQLTSNVSFAVADPNTLGSVSFSAECVISWSAIASPPGEWTDCAGDKGFAVLIPGNTFLSVGNFEVEVRHGYSSAYQ